MSTPMSVLISLEIAQPQWGEKALISFSEQGAVIHLTAVDDFDSIQRAARKFDSQGLRHLFLQGDQWTLEAIWSFYQGYRDPKKKNTLEWKALEKAEQIELEARIKVADWTRDIINKSAEEVAPRQLATMAAEFIKSLAPEQVSYRIVKDKDLLTEGWEGIFAVGRGSERTSAMLQLDFNPTGDENAPVFACLVGKGITFDSGGYSLKPSNFMSAMKADMGGAGTITGALGLAIMRGLNQRVKLILCCAENMVSGRALKLGDVITYKNGKTVEIMNTDAEGRLVLADGLIYASEQNPALIIDCATLTGAAKNALGNDYHAMLSFDETLSQTALMAAKEEREGLWALPLAEFHREMLPSSFADLSNISSGDYSPGASTAAAFLSYFVDNYQQGWLHFDCAGTYRKSASDKWAAGATAMGVKTIARLLLEQAK
ncbi:aminopeptidase PepB [Vibrio cincinnatiensis]|jgi:PepB aminopeptidase|uniref:Peptidase B n=1 Tax=Vibrio cincinnatiensis DSM 19608 TaxID=1123491 RepID=A0A1T4NAF0_VIBCI|nr:aminopeptidase PepB [Vibrio cincinnatiensis]MCG3721108.1 aminopeptidase PepB [Vibrio cincinnatiensis]MCG3725061.1 aminopeptidase PepB [Vibrio cincinnatiensis]MCG3731969.1 aminopeptidase PepB [Vibrio cincinnatiensis]MCG3739363.1 aminopeptidase PepB [Vibrio cincinnatiensis]MCG3743304.1 aminopeptidase PepB [Vibrio cincinnatiensis]